MPRSLLLTLFLLASQFAMKAQVEAGFHYGRILKINSVFPEVTQNAWVATLGMPLDAPSPAGIHFWIHGQLYQFGNPEVLGYGVSVMPSLEFRFAASQNAWLSLRQGASLAYMSRPYDRATNPTNNIIGAPLSLAAQTSFAYHRHFASGLSLTVGASFSHFSNGNSRIPNLGVNIPAGFVRVGYERSAKQSPPQEKPSSPARPKSYWGLRLGLGTHAFKVPDGPSYRAWSISPFWSRMLRPNLDVQIGFEAFYDAGSAAFAREQEFPPIHWRAIGLAPYVGIAYRLQKLALILQTGPYVKTPFPHSWRVYTRLGLEYHWDRCFVGGYIHAHGGEADYLDVSLGWKF
ncbi:MAG: acyloxyacyl hydrolase [Bacteroidota bacterium]